MHHVTGTKKHMMHVASLLFLGEIIMNFNQPNFKFGLSQTHFTDLASVKFILTSGSNLKKLMFLIE